MNINIIIILFFIINKQYVQSSLLDYVLSFGSETENKQNVDINNGVIDQNIPYEVATIDEKFINEAAQLTGLALSELDSCQHRVVLKLQTECHNLNDEQVSKLAVMLLNCQSAIEGRSIYPCTERMSLRECTSSMDPDIWNSYHIMTNRARAVCYSVRQAQFRGLTEMTVNKLMNTAHEQLRSMSELSAGQQKLHETTLNSIQAVSEGQEQLKKQQSDLQQAQLMGQLAIEDNIQQLVREKALIKAGHEQIAKMTQDVRLKLDDASTQIELQNVDQRHKHNQILKDLMAIQKKAEDIWQRIEESTTHMLEQSARASRQYEVTLAQLEQVNSTVHEVFNLVEQSRAAIDNKLTWLTDTLGGTGNTIDKLYLCFSHILYLVFSMILCSFLNAPKITRYLVVTIVPLNLILSLQKGIENAFPLPGLSFIIVSITIAHMVLISILTFMSDNNIPARALTWVKSSKKLFIKSKHSLNYQQNIGPNSRNEFLTNHNVFETRSTYKEATSTNMEYDSLNAEEDDDIVPEFSRSMHEFSSPTPPISREDVYLSRHSRSRSNTPVLSPISPVGSLRRNCSAKTRMGTLCKNSSLPGRDFCYRHQSGDSVVG